MKRSELINKITSDLEKQIKSVIMREEVRRGEILIDVIAIKDVAKYFLQKLKCRLVIATAAQLNRDFEIYYHFSHDATGFITNVKVVLPFENPVVDSIANLTTSANWIEREMHELYGIEFRGHPKMEKLISDGNWEDGEYPFRKELELKA